ncbi:dTDP-4-dehydrorhamnose reductase [Roseinatronobacter alkalisoli]|uniref:dTDP-4-dehydrorhamnose reductase n=1 Tax=Roseinatronobacter alkalisoli TaxID=3028235 RepID=A0ABT5TA33_9RHOB|nr:dTDP-4-dehydrorhamnose reductase [Roseinatronobacter sp. HJB301]MDD7971970.1 dTDP-4-dehydrorhamnose reductase [Roseinatronobacter sp. HJB301]
MILVFGKTGQVACELARLAPDAVFLDRGQADLSDPEACAAIIHAHAPRAVINAAAYTAVDRAEEQEALAAYINGASPAAMARACAGLGSAFVHISTDYVFDGAGNTPFAPDHPPAPLNAYGRTKLIGETGVRAAGGVYAILRTSWVFSAHGSNFVRTMRRLGAQHDVLRVVADQIGGPTPARAIASACLHIAQALQDAPGKSGIYHFSGAPDTSWAEFARAIMAQAELDCRIEDIASSDYPGPAMRPLNSQLDCSALSTFGLARPDWRQGLTEVLQDLKGTS